MTLILDYDIISKETKTNNRAVGGDMLLRQIKYFCTIVEEGSFTEAAEKCFISQSAISQQIQSLEKELGVKLIKRENRRFSLTHAGEYMYRHGTALLLEAERICKEVQRIGRDDELILKIAYPKHYSSIELNNAIALFSEKYPEVSISVITGTHEEIYDLLRSDDIDIAINDQRRAFSDEFVNFELGKARCYAEVCLRNDLSQKERVTVDDLKNMKNGVQSASAAVWSNRDQSDLQWVPLAVQDDGKWTGKVNVKKKTKNKGMYNIHVYMIDGTGTQYNVAQDMVKLE